MHSPQPCRFLDLPLELRLVVYEHLPSPPTNLICKTTPNNSSGYLILSTTKFQTALLATCKLINTEATPYLKKAINSHEPAITYSSDLNATAMPLASGALVQILVLIKTLDIYPDAGKIFTNKSSASLHLPPANNFLHGALLYLHHEKHFSAAEVPAILDFCIYAMVHARKSGSKVGVGLYWPGLEKGKIEEWCEKRGTGEYMPEMKILVLEKLQVLLVARRGQEVDVSGESAEYVGQD